MTIDEALALNVYVNEYRAAKERLDNIKDFQVKTFALGAPGNSNTYTVGSGGGYFRSLKWTPELGHHMTSALLEWCQQEVDKTTDKLKKLGVEV